MKANSMCFSVIATCYNDENIISDYFDNMFEQTPQPEEYILVDGGSYDNTVRIVEDIKKKKCVNIKIISGRRLNIGQGYNEGIKESKYNNIIITGIGNMYNKHFNEELIKVKCSSEADIIYGVTKGQNSTWFAKSYNRYCLHGDKGILPELPSNRGCLINKEITKKIGWFCESFIYAGEDTNYYCRAQNANIVFATTNKAIIYWETPKSLREYRYQNKVYFIGRMQNRGIRVKDYLSYAILALAIAYILFWFLFHNIMLKVISLLILYFALAIRIQTFNIVSIFMYFYELVSPTWLLIMYGKYSKGKYRVIS